MVGTYIVTHIRNFEMKQLSSLVFSLCFEILTWYLVCECVKLRYKIKFAFNSGLMIFGRVMALGLWNVAKYLVGIWVYIDELQFKLTFRPGLMIFGKAMALGLWNLAKYLVVTTLFHYDLIYWLDFWHETVCS